MKKIFFMLAVVGCFSFSEVRAQDPDLVPETTKDNDGPNFSKLDVSPLDVVLFRNKDKKPVARVLYSRPQMRDREIFGKLVPYGEVWRTGANEATEITLYTDMQVGGKTIKAGTYSLYTIPQENEWTIILNKSTNIWGAMDYHVEGDTARIKVPVKQAETTIESLSMAFEPMKDGVKLQIGWANHYVEVPFKEI